MSNHEINQLSLQKYNKDLYLLAYRKQNQPIYGGFEI